MEQEDLACFDARKALHQIASLREEMNQRFEEMDREVRLVAEAILSESARLDLNRSRIDARLTSLQDHIDSLNSRLRTLQNWRDRQQDDVTDAVRKVVEKYRQRETD